MMKSNEAVNAMEVAQCLKKLSMNICDKNCYCYRRTFSRIEMIVLKDEYGSVYIMHLIKNILYHGEEDEFVVVKMATRMCIFKPRALEKELYHHRFQGIHNSINGPLPQSLRLELFEDEKCFLPYLERMQL